MMEYKPQFSFYTSSYIAMVILFLCGHVIDSIFYGAQPLVLTTHQLVNYMIYSITYLGMGWYLSNKYK